MILFIHRAVTNAKDRKADKLFHRAVQLPAVPRAGDYVTIDVHGRSIEVSHVEFCVDNQYVFVWLRADHRTFKGGDFEKIAADYKKRGWLD